MSPSHAHSRRPLPPLNPITLLSPRRHTSGISAILLPFAPSHEIGWDGLRAHIVRTAHVGITPAVNMDTGYANLIDAATPSANARPRHGMVSGCFPLDRFYAARPEAAEVERVKAARASVHTGSTQ